VDLGTMALVDRFVVKHANINKSEVDGYNTRDFDIEVSADGSAWTRVVAVTGNTKDVTAHVTAPISARWVRLNIVNGGIDGVARIYEFEVYGTPGTNQARGRSTKGSTSCTSAQSSAKAVDGRVDSGDAKWCSGASSKYVQVDLGSARTVKWIVLKHAGVRESASLNTRSFRILVSSDLTTWRTVSTITGNTESVTTHPITPTSARYVKVEVVTPAQTSDTRARIYEMEVYK